MLNFLICDANYNRRQSPYRDCRLVKLFYNWGTSKYDIMNIAKIYLLIIFIFKISLLQQMIIVLFLPLFGNDNLRFKFLINFKSVYCALEIVAKEIIKKNSSIAARQKVFELKKNGYSMSGQFIVSHYKCNISTGLFSRDI